MSNPVAIIVAALIVAAAIAFSTRWEIIESQSTVLRLDRWTGTVTVCWPFANTASATIAYDCTSGPKPAAPKTN